MLNVHVVYMSPPIMQEVKYLLGQEELATKTITYYSTVLGQGSFTTVFKAKYEELPCAAKTLRPIYHDNPDTEDVLKFFQRQCEFLQKFQHPNIVQYLGLCHDLAKHPVLLMEMLDECLTDFLESCSSLLSFRVQSHICHDVALALAYLHSIGIIHGNISSDNVLLIGPGSRAKVGGFIMCKAVNAKHKTPLMRISSNAAYMPAEVFLDNPIYTEKLDCYSYGILAIQVMTLRNPIFSLQKESLDSGPVLVPSQKDYIDNIDRSDPLLDIAIKCLTHEMNDRPSAPEICRRLEVII